MITIGCSVFLPTTILIYGIKDSIIANPIQNPSVKIELKIKNSGGNVTNDASNLEIKSTMIWCAKYMKNDISLIKNTNTKLNRVKNLDK